jgi:hypothetical protein
MQVLELVTVISAVFFPFAMSLFVPKTFDGVRRTAAVVAQPD